MKKLFRCLVLALTTCALAGCDSSAVSVSSQGINIVNKNAAFVEQVCVDGVLYIRISPHANTVTHASAFVPKFNRESKVATCAGTPAPVVNIEVPATVPPFKNIRTTPAPTQATTAL